MNMGKKKFNAGRALEITLFEEARKIMDENILNQLKGGEPNPDIIAIPITIDSIYYAYLQINRYQHNKMKEAWEKDGGTLCITPNLVNQKEFINKLLTDNEFYEKWGCDIPKENLK